MSINLEPIVVAVKWVIIISAFGWWIKKIVTGIIDYLLGDNK